ncbi:MAG: hypothetical protein V7711_06225 [Pseudomonadales bacterium]
MTATNTAATQRRVVKDKPAHFFDSPETDILMSMVLALAGELSVVRERLDTHERLSQSQGGFDPDAVNRYKPDAEVVAQRSAARNKYLKRVLREALNEVSRASDTDPLLSGEALADILTGQGK